jgi:hypothetical protein
VGGTFFGLSIDAVYQQENGAVNLRSSFANAANPLPAPGLAAYASNDESWNLMGKYTFDLGEARAPSKRTVRRLLAHSQGAFRRSHRVLAGRLSAVDLNHHQ